MFFCLTISVFSEIAEIGGYDGRDLPASLRNRPHGVDHRRDHFETEKDVWKIALTIIEQRKQREIDPTMGTLAQCVAEAKADPSTARDVTERMQAVLSFVENSTLWYDQVKTLPTPVLSKLVRLGAKVARLVIRKRD
jgi:DNA-binding transcriptional regulator GbsR (MarR family)